MKRIILILLILSLALSLFSCKAQTPSQQGGDSQPGSSGSGDGSGSGDADPSGGGTGAGAAKLTGKMNLIKLDDRDPSVLKGVTIKGNHAGSYDGINGKKSSLTDVRCIFELNEWIYFYPDTDAKYGLRVWILKHRDDQEYYNTCKFSDLMPNFASYCDLHYPEDEEKPDEWYWGSFYLNKEDCEPGYYDFVFTYEGKAIAVLQTRFYKENELTVKSDAELEALMRQ